MAIIITLFLDVNEHYHSKILIHLRSIFRLKCFRCERALSSPSFEGIITEFCREKGHGYIQCKGNPKDLIFAHVSE